MRKRPTQIKAGRGGSKSKEFISKVPDEVLLMILCLLPIKDAVVTSSVSKRWRFLWCNLFQLNFDGSAELDKIARDPKLHDSEMSKFVDQVSSVIESYSHPMVEDFRIGFSLGESYAEEIDEWLQFAVNKKVETLELDLMKNGHEAREYFLNYDFPLWLSDRNIEHLFKPPFSTFAVVELVSLKKLVLKGVNVCDAIIPEILANSPHLETICIHHSGDLTHVEVGGQALKLKYFEIAHCYEVECIHLYKFDLVSFAYKGPAIDLRLVDLPKLKELDIDQGLAGLDDNVFGQISTCLSYLQILSFKILQPKDNLMLNSFPTLPKVKKLMVTVGAHEDDSLLEVASIVNSCPSLEIFMIKLLWISPIKTRRKVRRDATHPHEHLKLLEIQGYFGRMSDLELAAYVIDNAAALKKILIDPRCQPRKGSAIRQKFSPTSEEAARSSAKRQLQSLTPAGIKLVIH